MEEIKSLEPRLLWENFYALTRIPRTSGNEKAVIDYIDNYAKGLGLETLREDCGNLIIRKGATEGYEGCDGVILQGHCDMVGEKESGCDHNFMTDGIDAYIDGNYVRARGTTLGADNGIGIAVAMAILADKSVEHGPLEVLITVDEERTMGGAMGVKSEDIKGRILINMDSEKEGEIVVGCAGGTNVRAIFTYTEIETAEEDIAFKVKVSGLKGGHSGLDIHLPLGNANKLLARFLKYSVANYESMISEIVGGEKHNSIPREAYAVVTIDTEDRDDFIEAVDEFEEIFREEYPGESGLKMSVEQVVTPEKVIDEMTMDDVINALQGSPNGIIKLSDVGVETSLNLSIVRSGGGKIEVIFLVRSMLESSKADVVSSLESVLRLAGAHVEVYGEYSGWRSEGSEKIFGKVLKVYRQKFGRDGKVVEMHAGLECGILGNIIEGMEMVSIGPTIVHPHSPMERVEIGSVGRFWCLLLELLKGVVRD